MNARGLSAIITIAKNFDEGELLRIMNSTNGIITVFAGSASRPFAQKMCDYLGVELGKSTTHIFPRAEYTSAPMNPSAIRMSTLFNPSARILTMRSPSLFLDRCVQTCKCKLNNRNYSLFRLCKSRQKDEPRVSIRARVCADCIEMCGADRVVTMDLHAAQVQGFFSKPVDHLYASALLCEYARHLGIVNENLVVVSPDAGSAKRARAYANILGCNVAIGDKVRIGHDENPNALEIIGDVKGKTCMVVDDFTISGNTLCKVAYGLMDKGAKEIYAFLSHAIVKEDAVKRIEESPIKMLVTTDTVDNTDVLKNSKKIKVVSAAPLFAEAVRTIHEREPMAYMFEHLPARLMEMSFEDTDK